MLQQTVTEALTPGAKTSSAKAGKAAEVQLEAADDRPPVRVVSGTYGRACNAKAGNATTLLARACDGKSACDYAVEAVPLENAAASCGRDFVAEWKCGAAGVIYSATLPADAVSKHEKLRLACAG